MAPKITSSSSRSKAKAKKPVTSDKGRANRSKVATATTTNSNSRAQNTGARVTNSAQRTSTGSAKVTGTPQKALPPARKGALATRADVARMRGSSDTVRGSGVRTGQPGATRPALPPATTTKTSAPKSPPNAAQAKPGVRARIGKAMDWVAGNTPKQQANIPKPNRIMDAIAGNSAPKPKSPKPPAPAASGQSQAWLNQRRNQQAGTNKRTGLVGAVAGALTEKFLDPLAFKAGVALGNNVLRPIGEAIDRATGKPKPPAASTPRRVGNIPVGEGTGRGSPNDPPRRSPAPSGSGSGGGGRSSGGGGSRSSSSAPSRPASRPAAPAMPSAVTKATPAAAAPKPASKGPNIGPMADGDKYGKAKKLESKIAGTSDTDMKRRRAFLDAKDSMSGAKAVRELQEKRKKKLSGMLSSETTITPSKQQY